MSKIVCDVCGTSYADSATQCPICGCVRPGESVINSTEIQEDEVTRVEGYTYVKGGRFSRSNVRKRSLGENIENEVVKRAPTSDDGNNDRKNDKGLLAAVCLLLLAIVAVIIYIVVHFFGNQAAEQQSTSVGANSASTSTSATTLTTEVDLTCTEIILAQNNAALIVGESLTLDVTTIPEDTTDAVIFASSNDAIATVSADGVITAISEGEATIIITCGQISAEFVIVCNVPQETTDATQATEPTVPGETTQPSVGYVAPFRLNRHIKDKPTERDATVIVGESFQLKLLDANDKEVPVEWTVEKSSVCTVNGNTVKAKSSGTTTITTTYEDITYTCLVRVK